ncbi:MAG: glycosyltransferase [Planctomycetaceae bacterium]|nr:glycosyltransferase [Planctomycetaceae bacterium]
MTITESSPKTDLSRDGTATIRPLFSVGGLYSLANGVAWIMRDLAAAMGRVGSPVSVYAADCWGRGAESIGDVFEPPTRWVSARGLWMGGLSWSPAVKRLLNEEVANFDVVHTHSMWMLPNSYACRAAHRAGIPVVMTNHGNLEPWAIRRSAWKKRITGAAFQDRDLRRAECIQVNTESEIDGVRQYGLTCPIAVIPNGIHLPDFEALPSREAFDEFVPQARGKHIALFMARLHQKKGLGHLIPAWSEVMRSSPNHAWHLVLAGPDNGFEISARRLVKEVGCAEHVTFTGGLNGEHKRAALSAADLFVQPSFSEGFSMSIIEAMACRLPVLMTPDCNFIAAADAGAARLVDPTVESTTDGLLHLMSLSDAERQLMGERGHELIANRYTWDRVAQQTLGLYRWLINGGSSPEFIRI